MPPIGLYIWSGSAVLRIRAEIKGRNPAADSTKSFLRNDKRKITRTYRDTKRKGDEKAMDRNEASKFYPSEPMIPKWRFDSVNLCLKETKRKLAKLSAELGTVKKRNNELGEMLLNTAAEKALAVHRAKDIAAAKALIDFSNLKPEDGVVPGLEEEVLRIK